MRDPIPAVLGAVLSVTVAACGAQEPAAGPRTIPGAQPVEYGAIAWHRELDAALAAARAARQPVLMLFQEVPGWSTCKDYGAQVLSHPMIVEAAGSLFVPVVVHNNSKDPGDLAALKAFDEPAWNNPVVRVIDAERRDLAPRVDRWTLAPLTAAMRAALGAEHTPAWLAAFDDEVAAHEAGLETAIFGMSWFWVGEAEFGLLEGVVATRPGFVAGAEVVEVRFDPRRLAYGNLLEHARTRDCTTAGVWTTTDAQLAAAREAVGDRARPFAGTLRPDGEPKYRLRRTDLAHVPLTPLQGTRANALVAAGRPRAALEALLSPRQRAAWARVAAAPEHAWPVLVDRPLPEAWARFEAAARTVVPPPADPAARDR